MLILDGYESYISAPFEEFCRENNIVFICLPFYFLHFTQLLDVGLFSWLKRIYGWKISTFIRGFINYITKIEFFLVFYAAYKAFLTPENMAGGFKGVGIILFNPEIIINKLNIKVWTPTPAGSLSANIKF